MTSPSPMADAPKPLTLEQLEQLDRDTSMCEHYRAVNCLTRISELRSLIAEVTASRAARGETALVEAAKRVIEEKFSTYKAGNGRDVGIQGDDGEKCWIVHSDAIYGLEAALAAAPAPAEADALRAARLDGVRAALKYVAAGSTYRTENKTFNQPYTRNEIRDLDPAVIDASTAAAGEKDNG